MNLNTYISIISKTKLKKEDLKIGIYNRESNLCHAYCKLILIV